MSRARKAGPAALPALIRSLCGDSPSEAAWAQYLLAKIGGERVLNKVHELLRNRDLGDEVKARLIGLLADLRKSTPKDVTIRDPDAMLLTSVSDLVGNLGSRTEVRHAVQMILDQVPEGEIPTFVREVIDYGGDAAVPLLKALMNDPRTPRAVLPDLERMGSVVARLPQRRSPRDNATVEAAMGLLQTGKPQRAQKLLGPLAAAYATDAEIRSTYGVCLLELGAPEDALPHLQAAADLEPTSGLNWWNVAAAARTMDQMGLCYKVLLRYLRAVDHEAGAGERNRDARTFCQAYEMMLQDAYPGIALDQVLAGEEMFVSAYAALSESRYDEAMERFREVLDLVPRHYPSWGNLGAAYLAMDRPKEARHCLQRALELNPDYSIARENMALLEGRA